MALPESLALPVPKKQTISSLLIFFSFSPPPSQSKTEFSLASSHWLFKALVFLGLWKRKSRRPTRKYPQSVKLAKPLFFTVCFSLKILRKLSHSWFVWFICLFQLHCANREHYLVLFKHEIITDHFKYQGPKNKTFYQSTARLDLLAC